MNPSSFRLWEAVPAAGKPISVGNRDIPLYSEWVRLLVGRSLAFAQRGPQGNVEYLVLGVPLPELSGDQGARARVREAVNVDFDVLRDSLRKHRQIVTGEPAPTEQATTFLRAYQVLGLLRLPESDREWRVTDEGLTIVQWGLETGRPFFDWTDAQLEAMRDTLLKRVDQQLPDNGGVMAQQRRHSEHEGRQQTEQIDEMLADQPAAAPRTPTRSTTGSPIAIKPQTPAVGTSPVTAQNRRHVKWIPAALGEWDGRQVSSLAALLAVALAAGLVAGVFAGKRGTGADPLGVDPKTLKSDFKTVKNALDLELINSLAYRLNAAHAGWKRENENYNFFHQGFTELVLPDKVCVGPDLSKYATEIEKAKTEQTDGQKRRGELIAVLTELQKGLPSDSSNSATGGGDSSASPALGPAGTSGQALTKKSVDEIKTLINAQSSRLAELIRQWEERPTSVAVSSEFEEFRKKFKEMKTDALKSEREPKAPHVTAEVNTTLNEAIKRLESQIDPPQPTEPATNPVASSTEGDQGAKQDGKKSAGTKKNEGQQQTAPPAPPAGNPPEPNTPPAPSVPPPDTSPTPPPNSNNVTAGDKKGGGA